MHLPHGHNPIIPMNGRSLTLYEKIHTENELNTNKAHQAFLDLQQLF
ncbi:hypothetical protein [Pseudoalteromonas porphyrae]|nr:hypothetical protein [Pseudoalteromonas porphyrae]